MASAVIPTIISMVAAMRFERSMPKYLMSTNPTINAPNIAPSALTEYNRLVFAIILSFLSVTALTSTGRVPPIIMVGKISRSADRRIRTAIPAKEWISLNGSE